MAVFKSIEIHNFRAYRNASMEFRDNNGVYLISGENKMGKSTFLNAFNWCLYGDTPFFVIEEDPNVVNDEASDSEITFVRLCAEIDGVKYAFRRSTRRGMPSMGAFEVQKEEMGNWSKLDTLAEREAVNSILPKDIRHLFFFNGEQLKDIYTNNKEHNLKDNVYRVSEINIIDNAIHHLRRLEDLYLREITKSNKNAEKIQKLQNDKISVEAVLKNDLKAITETMNDKNRWEEKINDLDAILRETKDGRLLQAQRDTIQEKVKQLDGDIQEAKLNKQECIKDTFHKALLHDKFKKYYEALKDARDKSLIPPPVDPKITEEILRTGICLCGESLTDKGREHIKTMNEEYARRKNLQFLTDGIYKFSDVNSYLPNARYAYIDICDEILKKTTEKEELGIKLKAANEQLEKLDLANLPKDPEFTRTQYEEKLEECRNKLLRLKTSTEENRRELKQIEEDLEKAIAKDETSNKIEQKRQVAEKMVDKLEEIKASMETIIRKKLQERTWKSFSGILPPQELEGIQISESYDISLVKNGGKVHSINQASTGQIKALGLSLVHALSMDLGYSDSPLLIDNLYGDISEKYSSELTKLISSLANNKQIIIMNLDMERIEKSFDVNLVKGKFEIKKTVEEGAKILEYKNE